MKSMKQTLCGKESSTTVHSGFDGAIPSEILCHKFYPYFTHIYKFLQSIPRITKNSLKCLQLFYPKAVHRCLSSHCREDGAAKQTVFPGVFQSELFSGGAWMLARQTNLYFILLHAIYFPTRQTQAMG